MNFCPISLFAPAVLQMERDDDPIFGMGYSGRPRD